MSDPRITTVVCDFGGVLTNPLWNAFASVQVQSGVDMEAFGRAIAAVKESEGVHPLYELECGRITEARFLALLTGALETDLGRPVDLARFQDHFWEGLVPNEPMLAEVARVRDAGFRTFLLTNNVVEWEPRWRSMFAVDELFEGVVDSGFVGMRKPEPGIYALTEQRLGVPGPEIVFVDDFPVNCEAARAAGWTAVQFGETDQAIAELRAVLEASGVPPRAPAA